MSYTKQKYIQHDFIPTHCLLRYCSLCFGIIPHRHKKYQLGVFSFWRDRSLSSQLGGWLLVINAWSNHAEGFKNSTRIFVLGNKLFDLREGILPAFVTDSTRLRHLPTWPCNLVSIMQLGAPDGSHASIMNEMNNIFREQNLRRDIGVQGGGLGGATYPPGLKNFRATRVFLGKRKLLKNPE